VIKFRTSYVADLTLADRIIYASQDYNIVSIQPVGTKLALIIVGKRTG
jgi:hypothetical protein